MIHYVLIMALYGGGATVTTADFDTVEACAFAGQQFVSMTPVGYTSRYHCVSSDTYDKPADTRKGG